MLRDMLGPKQEVFMKTLEEQYANDKTARVVGHAHVKVDTIEMGGMDPSGMGDPMMGQGTPDWTRFAKKMSVEEITTPIIGRQMELERMVHILSRRDKNCPMLIGEPGVGKTAESCFQG